MTPELSGKQFRTFFFCDLKKQKTDWIQAGLKSPSISVINNIT